MELAGNRLPKITDSLKLHKGDGIPPLTAERLMMPADSLCQEG
jgi:hypothetical protein